MKYKFLTIAALPIIGLLAITQPVNAEDKKTIELLNVSYDPTRELYDDYNKLFAKHWKEKTGQDVKISQSHGGSGKQARSIIDGLRADVATLALAYDIDAIAQKAKLLPTDWQSKFSFYNQTYTTNTAFSVKKGNPKHIKDWDDLVKPGVSVITPNPKTSGGARWNYLAAYGYALKRNNNDEAKAREFVGALFKNVPVLDTGARGATITFVERGIGDVLIAWENEAYLAVNQLGKNKFDVVVPSISILAEPPVAILERNTDKNGTTEVATEYLNYLYSPEAQEIIAKNHYRPSDAKVAAKYASQFPQLELLNIKDFGGWSKAQKAHFDDGGTFDQIYKK